jgi:phosphoglycerate kinase
VSSFKTLDDFDVKDKTVLVRIDVNSPLDRNTKALKDHSKIASSVPTLKELSDKGAKVVILAHQGRRGHWDYCELDKHAEVLSSLLGKRVKYVDDLFGSQAKKAISSLKSGELLLLKNVRCFEDEDKKMSPEQHAKGKLVSELAGLFDLFVNDAFASAHRSHASIVGFAAVLPSAAGRLMQKEIESLSRIVESPERPCVFVFGGTKFVDSIPIVEHLLASSIADRIILGGLVGLAYSAAIGKNIGQANLKMLEHELTADHVGSARKILERFGDRIALPLDVALDQDGTRVEMVLDHDPPVHPSLDIGSKSIDCFSKILAEARTILISGPVGVFEREEFAKGTKAIFESSVSHGAFCVIGGGHTTAAANQFSYAKKISYISTGGGALEHFLLGKPLPAIEALKSAARRMN